MGFQSRESGVPGEGSFPAGQHSCALRREGDGAPSGGPEAHFHSPRIQPPLCGPGLPRAAEQSAIHARAGFLPAARSRRWAGPGTPACRPGRAARPGAHRARFRPALAGAAGLLSAGSTVGIADTRLHFCAGGCGHGVFSAWKSSVRPRLVENEDVRFHGPLPDSHPRARDGTAQVPQL